MKDGLTTKPVVVPKLNIPLKNYYLIDNYIFALSEDGIIYKSGSINEREKKHQTIAPFDADYPDEPAIDLRIGAKVYFLTQSHKIYY